MSWLDQPPPSRLERWWSELKRAMVWRRRLLVAGFLAGSMAFALQALTPSAPAGQPVLVAVRDLAAGSSVDGSDVVVVRRLPSQVPAGVISSLAGLGGRSLVSSVRQGEVLTDVRLAGPSALRGLPAELVAVPVRIADPEAAALVRPGDHIDLLAAGAVTSARVVASAVRVLAVPGAGGNPAGVTGALGGSLTANSSGALLLVAATPETAALLAAAAVTDRISLVLRHY